MNDTRGQSQEQDVTFPPGSKLAHFHIEHLLGEGAMGEVYKAIDTKLQRQVALKLICYSGDRATLRNVLTEARNQAHVDHENICKVYEWGEIGEYVYIAMQLIEGETLDEALETLTLNEKASILRDVALGLQAAHDAGMIHRDVKPENIILERAPEGPKPYLTDFGLARALSDPHETIKGVMKGSPYYMSPEQIEAGPGIDHRSDIYNLGATLYHVLTEETPHEGESTVAVLINVLEHDPAPIGKLAPELPIDLRLITMKCLEKEPERRYNTAREVAEELDRYLNHLPVQATPPGTFYLITKLFRRHRAVFLTSLLAPLFLIIGVIIASIGMMRSQKTNQALLESQNMALQEARKTNAINRFLRDMMGAPMPDQRGGDVKVADLLDQARVSLRGKFDDQPEVKSEILILLAQTNASLGNFEAARDLIDNALKITAEHLPENHISSLRAIRLSGVYETELGKSIGIALAQDALSLHRKHLGDFDKETLEAWLSLVNVQLEQGLQAEAEEVFQEGYRIARDVLDQRHPLLTQFKASQSRIDLYFNRGVQAEKILRELLTDLNTSVSSSETIDQIVYLERLAFAYRSQIKYRLAYQALLEVESMKRDVFGPEHLETIITQQRMAWFLIEQERYEEAEPLVLEVLSHMERTYGEKHFNTLRSRSLLSEIYFFDNRYESAKVVLEKNLRISSHLNGEDHMVYIRDLYRYASVLHQTQRYSEASYLLEHALEDSKARFGQTHTMTLQIMNLYATLMRDQEDYDRARPVFEALEDLWPNQMYADPGEAIYRRNDYGCFLWRTGDYVRAEAVLKDLYQEIHSQDRVQRRVVDQTLNNLIDLYEAWEKEDKAHYYREMLTDAQTRSENGVYFPEEQETGDTM